MNLYRLKKYKKVVNNYTNILIVYIFSKRSGGFMNTIEKVKQVEDYIVKCRRDLHQIPEIGFDLPKTSKYVASELKKMGIEIHENVGVSGIVGLIKGSKDGKTIALRADMDALPIKEETGLKFASTNGNMHACGHDTHTAMLLGAAKILSENRNEIHGNVKLIFQPAEESPGGAKPMLNDGAFENPKVDAVFGIHGGNLYQGARKGTIIVCPGNMMASLDRFKLKLIGKGCHGAYPQTGVDPIVMTGYFLSATQSILSREISATDSAVITIGKINGGNAYNVVPDYVELEGTVRAGDQKVRENISKRLEGIAKGISEAMRGSYELDYTFGYPPLVNNKKFTEEFIKSAKKVMPEEDIKIVNKAVMGSEDFAYYLEEVPGTFIFLNNQREVDGVCHPNHNSKFDIEESLLSRGTALIVQTALDYLG
jgi:amidohydrolase